MVVEHQTALSKHRMQKAGDDLQASQLLLENNKLTQSINRSYYSIFHATRALLALESFDSRKHTGVISFFNKHFIKTGRLEKKYSSILMDAKDFRKDSDYDDVFVVSRDEAAKQLSDARAFIERIKSFIETNYASS